MSEIKREDALGIGIVDLLVVNGSLKDQLNKSKESQELYSKFWRDEKESHQKTQESLLEVTQKSVKKIEELEGVISNVFGNLNLIVNESKSPKYNPKRDIEKIKVIIKDLEKK